MAGMGFGLPTSSYSTVTVLLVVLTTVPKSNTNAVGALVNPPELLKLVFSI